MTTEKVRAEDLRVGDVILQPGYDAEGAYTEWEFTVTATPRLYPRKVRFQFDGTTTRSLDRDVELRVRREGEGS